MSKLDHNRDVLRMIDDAARARSKVHDQPKKPEVTKPLFENGSKKERAYQAFIVRCAVHKIQGKALPPVPSKIKAAIGGPYGAYEDFFLTRWLETRPEYENARRMLLKKKKYASR